MFQRLKNQTGIPWGNDTSLATKLDLIYLNNHSGERYVSPILNKDDDTLTSSYKDSVISAAFEINKNKWTRLWEVATADFDPIENYSMIETHTGTETGLKTPTGWKETETQTPTNWKETKVDTPTNWKETKTDTPTNWKTTETQTPDEWVKTTTQTPDDWEESTVQTPTDWVETTEGLKADNTSESTGSVYAFNSSAAVPSTKAETEVNSKSTKTQEGTYTTTHSQSGSMATTEAQEGTFATETEQTGTYQSETSRTGTYQSETSHTGTFQTETSHTGTFEDKMTYNTTLTRSGNIGVTTSQMMLESSIKLWQWSFFETVFRDLDQILTLDTY